MFVPWSRCLLAKSWGKRNAQDTLISSPPRMGYRHLLLLTLELFLSSCGLIDLRPVSLSTVPSQPNQILPAPYSPVILSFDTAMEAQDVERALVVSGPQGTLQGKLHWEGNSLWFVPPLPWEPGQRYEVACVGTLPSRDGRELRAMVKIPFYGILRGELPYLVDFSPPDGASVGVDEGTGAFVRLWFSQPMDRVSVQGALSWEVPGGLEFRWDGDDRAVSVLSRGALTPWKLYTWTLSNSAKSQNQVSLSRSQTGHFVTDADRELPRVLRTFPVQYSPSQWLDTGESLDGIEVSDGIGIRFSKPMNGESLRTAIRFEPPVAGSVELMDPQTAVFVNPGGWECQTSYRLVVGTSVRDTSGLAPIQEYVQPFFCAVPFLDLALLQADRTDPLADPSRTTLADSRSYPVYVEEGEGLVALTIRFSLPFSPSAQVRVPLLVGLESYFPLTLRSVSLKSVLWLGTDTVRLVWSSLERGTATERHLYKLRIPGRKAGISNGLGQYFKEDHVVYLEALP